VGDLSADVLAAYLRHLEAEGGRGGGPASPATLRVYSAMLKALIRELVGEQPRVGSPRHHPGPPEAITAAEWKNLLRVPDLRTVQGRRDVAILRVLGDCGLRSAELRALRGRDVRRPRSNSRRLTLLVRGKGGREREVPIPSDCQRALEAWIAAHPLARRIGLLEAEPLFVRLGRHGQEPPEALSAMAVYRIVRRSCLQAGIPQRLAHPHALRTFWATRLLEAGVAIHEVAERLGHVDLRTTARYAATRPDGGELIAEVIDRQRL